MMLLGVLLSINQVWGAEVTVTKTISDVVSANSYTVSSGSTINTKCTSIDLDGNINVSVAVKQGATGNTGTFWGTSPNIDWRLYQGDEPTITISAGDGYTISKVKFTYSNSNTGVINTSGHGQSIGSTYQITSGTAYDVNAASAIYYVGNTSTRSNGQARITAIEVVYSGTSGGSTTYTDYLTECGAPQRTLYVQLPSDWYADAKYATYYWGGASSGWSDWMTTEYSCGEQVRSAEIPEDATNVAFVRFNSDTDVPGAVGKEWNRTGDLSVNAEKDYYHTLSKGGDNKYYGTWGNYTPKMTVSYTMNGHGDAIVDDCVTKGGTLASLPAAPKCAGYIFEGWFTDNTTFHNAFTTSTVVNTNIEVFAKWTAVANRTIYLKLNDDWAAAEAKYAIHYFTNGTGWSQFMTKGTGCYDGYYYTEIPGTETDIVVGRFNPSKASTGNWDDKWNQTLNINIPIEKNLVTVTTQYTCDCVDNGNYNSDLGVFSLPTYTISFVGGDGATGSMSDITDIACGSSKTIPANGFGAPAGKKFNGWKDQDENNYSADATINPVTKDLTLTAQWADVPTWTITLNAGTGSVSSTSVNIEQGQAYGSSLPAAEPCASAASNGWTFAGWSATNVTEQTATAPTFVKSTDVPVANTPLYAVYKKGASAPIGYNIKFTASGTTYYVSGGVSNKTMAVNTNKANAALFEIEHVGDDVATALIHNVSGTKTYIYITTGTNKDLTEGATQPNNTSSTWKVTNTSITNVGQSGRGLAGRTGNSTTAVVNASTTNIGSGQAVSNNYYHAIALEEVMGYSYVYLSNPSCADMYSVAVSAADGGSAEATPASASAGQTVRLTATAGSSCYQFTSWTIKKTSDESDITSSVSLSGQTESATFTMPAYGVTVVPTFTKKQFEVRLHNGDNVTTEIVDCGDTYEFESVETGCDDVEFVGWTATAPNGSHTWASTPVVAANTGAVNAAKDYYAVFGKSEGATVTYNRISTLADADMGESFVIGYNDGSTKKALKGKLISTGDAYTSVNSSETAANKITPGADDWKWIITKVGDNYAIRNVSTGKYLTVNGADLGESNSVYADWTITFSGEGEARISSNGEYIMHTVSGGTNMFAAHYEVPTNIYLYKRTASLVYSSLNDCGGYHDIILNTTGEGSLVYTTPVGSAKTGATVTISNGAASGYKMSSQVVSADCGTVEVTDNKFSMPDCDVTITTIFRHYYVITYDKGSLPAGAADGASISGSNTTADKWEGSTITLKSSQFTCGGYTLSGWATTDGGEKVYELGGSYSVDEDITLYPVWTPKVDKYIDEMHGTTNYTGAGREMSGYYTIPILEDDDSGTTGCKTTHKKFIGWIANSNKAADGTIADENIGKVFTGGVGKAATGATYYAVWAVVNE